MIIDERLARKIVVRRQVDSHKGTYGRVLLIGGFYPYGGAIIMSALAAVHSGAGLTTVVTDEKNRSALHSHLPEAMIVAKLNACLKKCFLKFLKIRFCLLMVLP